MTEVDYVEVGRKAYELSYAHGQNARLYAAKLAAAALSEGQIQEHHFWKAGSSYSQRLGANDSN